MAKQPDTSTKLQREITQPDAFQRQASRSLDYLRGQQRILSYLAYAGVAAVLVGAILYYYYAGKREKAGFALSRASDIAALPVYPQGATPPPRRDLGLEPLPIFTDRNIKLAKVSEEWTAAQNLAASPAASFAQAGAFYNLGKYDQAITAYQAFLDAGRRADGLDQLAREGLALALEAKGDLPGASKAFADIAQPDPKGFYADTARFHLARLQEKQGQRDEAIKAYQSLITDFTDPKMALALNPVVEKSKARLRALGVEPEEPKPADEKLPTDKLPE